LAGDELEDGGGELAGAVGGGVGGQFGDEGVEAGRGRDGGEVGGTPAVKLGDLAALVGVFRAGLGWGRDGHAQMVTAIGHGSTFGPLLTQFGARG